MLRDTLPQSKRLRSSSSASGRGGVTTTLSSLPRGGSAGEFGERRYRLGGAIDPCFERFPVLGRNGDNAPVEHFDFGGFEGLATHEVAKAGVRFRHRHFENGPLVGIDPDAENRGSVWCVRHVYDNSIQRRNFQSLSLPYNPRPLPSSHA